MKCARCDFRTQPDLEQTSRAQLLEHADTAGHPLCVVCHRSLPIDDEQTCEQCLTESRSLLAGIAAMWVETDTLLGVAGSFDALTMVSPGGTGTAGRKLWPSELRQGLVQHLDGREHAVDNYARDPASVVQLLTQWEDDWRRTRQEPAALLPPAASAHVLHKTVGYLEVHTRWAAREHPAFDEYVRDLRSLHFRLEVATGRDDRQVRAEAECFRCGAGALVRELREGKACEHDSGSLPAFPAEYEHDDDGDLILEYFDQHGQLIRDRHGRVVGHPLRVPIIIRRVLYEQAVQEWEAAHGRCQQQGGYADQWICVRCRERYDWQRYVRAVKAKVEGTPAGDWGLPGHLALVHGISVKTILTWARRGVVAVACIVGDQRMRVSADDVRERAVAMVKARAQAEERRRKAEERKARAEGREQARGTWKRTG